MVYVAAYPGGSYSARYAHETGRRVFTSIEVRGEKDDRSHIIYTSFSRVLTSAINGQLIYVSAVNNCYNIAFRI